MMRFAALAFICFSVSLLGPVTASAFQGAIRFTEEEKAAHEQAQPVILEESAACLHQHFERHTKFYKKYGISPYYGAASEFAGDSDRKRRKTLKKLGLNPELVNEMELTSCITMAMKCLKQGFEKAGPGQAGIWKRIREFAVLNDLGGMAVQEALQQLGWKILYWNPDLSRNEMRAQFEKNRSPRNKDRFWGLHDERYQIVSTRGTYLSNRVDDFRILVNFGRQTPEFLKSIPFFLGTAHGGYHVFPGTFGQVIEAHAQVEISNSRTVWSSPFNPNISGGGPGNGSYHSGIIAIPARYLK
jgi:hypothetical protein